MATTSDTAKPRSPLGLIFLTILIDMFMTAPDKRKPDAVAEAQKALPKPFAVLNGALQGRDYLLGSAFTVAERGATMKRFLSGPT